MKTVDNLKAPKTRVERNKEMHIIGVGADVINQPLEPLLARLHGTWRRRGLIDHVVLPAIFRPHPTLMTEMSLDKRKMRGACNRDWSETQLHREHRFDRDIEVREGAIGGITYINLIVHKAHALRSQPALKNNQRERQNRALSAVPHCSHEALRHLAHPPPTLTIGSQPSHELYVRRADSLC